MYQPLEQVTFRPIKIEYLEALYKKFPVNTSNPKTNLSSSRWGRTEKSFCDCKDVVNCNYHIGVIKLTEPIINPIYEKVVCNIMSYICESNHFNYELYHNNLENADLRTKCFSGTSTRLRCLHKNTNGTFCQNDIGTAYSLYCKI